MASHTFPPKICQASFLTCDVSQVARVSPIDALYQDKVEGSSPLKVDYFSFWGLATTNLQNGHTVYKM